MKPRLRLSLSSVRVRLALWNVGVLALVLVVLGVALIFSLRARISAAVDSRLLARAHHMQRHGIPPPLIAPLLSGQDLPTVALPNGPWSFQDTEPGQPSAVLHPPDSGDDDIFGELRPRLFSIKGQSFQPGQAIWDPKSFTCSLQGEEVFSTVHDGGDTVRVLSVPMTQDGRVLAVLQCGNSMKHVIAEQLRMTRTLLTLIPLVLLVAGLGGAFLTDRALRPVRRIALEANKIGAENLSQRLPVTGEDEFADLAETFNGMLARLQSAFERQEQAIEQQKRFTADASHELRTPLTIIKANTSLALSNPKAPPEFQKTFRTVDAAADRMNRIMQDLLLLARSDAGQLTYQLAPTPLADVIAQAVSTLSETPHAPITVKASPSLRAQGHADMLVRLLGNLLENAIHYTPQSGQITVTADGLGDVVVIKVTDTGEGIPPEHLPHLTERFYRVDAARARAQGGTGLGLAICQSIMDAHGGELAIHSEWGKGTTVRVTLPRADDVSTSAVGDAPAERLALSGAEKR